MDKSKHTAGPWEAVDRDPDSSIKSVFTETLHKAEIPFRCIVSMGTMWGLGVDVAVVPAYTDPAEVEANVRLIAAAPDLYDALKLWIEKARFFSPDTIEYSMAWEQATAALAKAEESK